MKIVFKESKTVFRTLNGKILNDNEWGKLIKKQKNAFIKIKPKVNKNS